VLISDPDTHLMVEPTAASLSTIDAEIAAKREADVIRFRTCCADPRASK
jgi:hypothetical protein